MTDWTRFLTAFYKNANKKNHNYTFKNAMKDASVEYKKKNGNKTGKKKHHVNKTGKKKHHYKKNKTYKHRK